MNRHWMMRLGVCSVLFGGLLALAAVGQDAEKTDETKKTENKAPEPEVPEGPFMRAYHNALPFAADLNLTDEQKAKIVKIRAEYAKKLKALMLEERGKLEAVLTAEQKEKNRNLEKGYLKELADRQAKAAKAEADAARKAEEKVTPKPAPDN